MLRILCLTVAVWPLLASTCLAGKFEFKDGDRVVLLGNTLIERALRSGYWELALTSANPDKKITFRNLGWSGDTVWGEARGRFGGQPEGFRHLKDHVLALEPTVIILGYGFNESFAGPEGIANFQKGLDKLLDTLAPTKARIVILSPLRQEKRPAPLPDPAEQNKNLKLYTDALEKTAAKRGCTFVDFFALGDRRLTDNGIHLTAAGYRQTGLDLSKALGGKPARVVADAKGAKELTWKAAANRLPDAGGKTLVQVKNLPPGTYTLQSAGTSVRGSAADWARGIAVASKVDQEQVEKLRQTILRKNRLYFHRWRPQNETYLYLFRKREQGQNAKEIPQFDPLIEKLEREIAKLRVPVSREYRLTIDMEGK